MKKPKTERPLNIVQTAWRWSLYPASIYLLKVNKRNTKTGCVVFFLFFFLSWFSFTDTDDSQGSRGREGTIFYSFIPLPPAHKHRDIYLQICMWDGYHVFLIATLVFTRLLLDEIQHLIKLSFDWWIDDAMFVCLLDEWILDFCYSNLTWETGGFELASNITLVITSKPTKQVC